MGRPRLELQALLVSLIGEGRKVYFQPKADIAMTYPCIVYMRDAANRQFADNGPYLNTKRYQITVIDRDPDSDIPDKIAQLPLCAFAQHFVTENLHHDVYSLYF